MAKQLADRILEYLTEHNGVNSLELAEVFNEDHQKIIGAIKSLETVGDLITTKQLSQKKWEITSEGEHIIKNGSHEAAVYNAIPENGIPQSKLMQLVPFAKVGFSKALAAGWIWIDKDGETPVVRKKVSFITDTVQNHLKNIDSISDNLKIDYKKRKLLQEVVVKSIVLEKGPKFSTRIEKLEADLTSDLLLNGAWKDRKFKPYNFDALGAAPEAGHLHPLLKVRSEFRKIFIEMGFTEMPTNNYVESSFWNFDALFQPQQHPARDAHDTFFVSEPSVSGKFPPEYLEKVKTVHSTGGYGSQGYRYQWKLEEAQKNLLRTHTTAVSARMLYKLMQEGDFKPVKYFSIDRVFRNETLDATHLAEFHQIEGVIADYNLTLGDLIGVLYEFFRKLGITQLRFKPAYNPYTEPSMEVFCYHNGLQRWIEIGNSGMFRPEMLLPMGLPSDVNVIAWGLSLERPTMIKYGLNNIRDLVGPKVDMEMVHKNPICRLEKTSRLFAQPKIQMEETGKNTDETFRSEESRSRSRSQDVRAEATDTGVNRGLLERQNLVISCDPNYPIYSLEKLLSLAKSYTHVNVRVSTHMHSSVTSLPNELLNFCSDFRDEQSSTPSISVTLIWKIIGIDPIMRLPRLRGEILGEINIARYINRLIELACPDVPLRYETNGIAYANQIDSCLEDIHESLHRSNKKTLKRRSKSSAATAYAIGENLSIVDVVLESIERRRR